MIFFGRRILFAVSAIYLGEFLWAQLAIQMAIFFLATSYQLVSKYMDSPFTNRIELMNECTILLLTYGELHFTEYMSEPVIRNGVGYFYIFVVLSNVIVHLIILSRDTCIKTKFACIRFFQSCKFECRKLSNWRNQTKIQEIRV